MDKLYINSMMGVRKIWKQSVSVLQILHGRLLHKVLAQDWNHEGHHLPHLFLYCRALHPKVDVVLIPLCGSMEHIQHHKKHILGPDLHLGPSPLQVSGGYIGANHAPQAFKLISVEHNDGPVGNISIAGNEFVN